MSNKKISDFLANFKTDLARPNRFDVQINIPYILSPYVKTTRNLIFRCESTDLPGRTFATTERKIGSAPTIKFPYQTIYNDLNMTFIVDDTMDQKVFFDAWLELINPTTDYNFKYFKDYVSDIVINQYDVQNKLSYQVSLLDAYPLAVNQMDLSWSSDGYHKLNVVMAYNRWSVTTPKDILKQVGTKVISALDEIPVQTKFLPKFSK